MVKRRNEMQSLPPPMLVISRDEAFEKVTKRIELGNQIKNSNITSMEELKYAKSKLYTWNEFNEELLYRMFDNSSIREGYKKSIIIIGSILDEPLAKQVEEFRDDVDYYLRKLGSIRERLEIIDVSPRLAEQPPSPSQQQTLSKKVFLVHGHDDGMRETVARFIQKFVLTP